MTGYDVGGMMWGVRSEGARTMCRRHPTLNLYINGMPHK